MGEHVSDKVNVALIYGSTREGRMCEVIADWAVQRTRNCGGFELDVIDPLALDLPSRIEAKDGPAVRALQRRLDDADAFIVLTPEYNHGYSAALKGLIDSAYIEWNAKPVGFISYGGMAGGLRAVEQLRQVLAELHAVTMRDVVSFANPWDALDDAGRLTSSARATAALGAMLSQLRWWSNALKRARTAEPYPRQSA